MRLKKLEGQFLPTFLAASAASSLSAISRTALRVGANPHESRPSICLTIATSSLVSFFELGSQSCRSRSIDRGTSNVAAAHFTL